MLLQFKVKKEERTMFIDRAKIYVKAGDGGRGIVSFRREKHVPRGGPDGGNGGRGGNVLLQADSHLTTLMDYHYKRHYKAEKGQPGGSSNKTGRDGEDIVLKVPCGTVVYDAETGKMLGELVEPGSTLVVARGGKGGRGNAAFVSSTNRAPRVAEPGTPGEERWIVLELKLLADVGLVGFPNAGKSSLLRVITHAQPKVADYPFTTVRPYLGTVRYAPWQSFVVADIPGLIEGAHTGKGLGLEFLRHIERTRVLLFLLDPQNPLPIERQFAVLRQELEAYHSQLLDKPFIIAISKADLLSAEERQQFAHHLIGGQLPLLISSITREGLDTLVQQLAQQLQHMPEPAPAYADRFSEPLHR